MQFLIIWLIVLFGVVPLAIIASFMKPPSDLVYFSHGLRDLKDLEVFINSRALAVREEVHRELVPPHRLVMGDENSEL